MSDPFFPEPRHKSLWQRLTQVLSLEGGGDWKTETMASAAYWTCPAGTYEVYAKVASAGATIFHYPALPQTTLSLFAATPALSVLGNPWYPALYFQTFEGGALVDEYVCTLPHGWRLTTGERLRHTGATWYVRSRRIG